MNSKKALVNADDEGQSSNRGLAAQMSNMSRLSEMEETKAPPFQLMPDELYLQTILIVSSILAFQISTLILIALYLVTLRMKSGSYLLAAPGVLLEMVCLIKAMYRLKHWRKDSQHSLKLWQTLNMVARTLSYCFLFAWILQVEINFSDKKSLLPGFLPLTIYSLYSFGVDFFITSFKQISNIYVVIYKAFRLVFFVQLVTIEPSLNQLNQGKIDVEDLGSELWPLQVGCILLSPIVISGLVYYTYFIISKFVKDKKNLDKRHYVSYFWLIFNITSFVVVGVLCLKFKSKIFSNSDTIVINLVISLSLTFFCLLLTLNLKKPLTYPHFHQMVLLY